MFFDASTATTVKKKWKKLAAAEPTDSRVVWQHVTDAILREDEQGAADAKHEVCTMKIVDVKCNRTSQCGTDWVVCVLSGILVRN